MFTLLVILLFTGFLFLFFIRSLSGRKEDLFSLARKQREMVIHDFIDNPEGLKKEDDADVKHMLDLLSKQDDEIDYNK